MTKRPLTAAEKAAYRELANAAARLRKAQEAGERKQKSRQAQRLVKQARQRGSNLTTTADLGKGVADA